MVNGAYQHMMNPVLETMGREVKKFDYEQPRKDHAKDRQGRIARRELKDIGLP